MSHALRYGACGAFAALLAGCHAIVLDPAGDIARQQADLILVSTGLLLLIIVPVMVLTVVFAWRYRATNTAATYTPEWQHSTKLELVIWAAPLLIVIALGSITWLATHLLDPYRALDRIDARHPIARGDPALAPIDVDVVALDWKWLFIYPGQNIATVNDLVLPIGRPVRFHITSSSVMNSFFIPALAGQIYAMPGMETPMNAVFNKPGVFRGQSSNYSGAGFSQMHFDVHSVSPQAFAAWARGVKAAPATLDRAMYMTLETPSVAPPVSHYAGVAPHLFDAVVNMCVRPGQMCSGAMAAIDARGGTGASGQLNVAAVSHDAQGHERVAAVVPGLADAGLRHFVREWCGDNDPATQPLRAAVARDNLALARPLS
ncbi:ubiquinol oxidase subunit II [Novosphingobium sp.]|uniref:ubiquinol oxidase subunit II n=1 Tax=Novosphingobium sp. TaxID=1874826 RepID=UPI003B51A6E9